MERYVLFNDDKRIASFDVNNSIIVTYTPEIQELLPMQIRNTSAEGFSSWVRERAIDMNSFVHRSLMKHLIGSRDRITVSIKTHMYSISDTFTCFLEGDFTPRAELCNTDDQNSISDFILLSSDTSLRNALFVTPNASTEGSYTKTWRYEDSEWWLYKIENKESIEAEIKISQALIECGWDTAVYQYSDSLNNCVRSRNFLKQNEFFEPYDSFRFFFDNTSDADDVINNNIASLGEEYLKAWKKIMIADALFGNTDRHMRNFGLIRSSITGEVLRLAPNFDNNQAMYANPGKKYPAGMLKIYMETADDEDRDNLKALLNVIKDDPYFIDAYKNGSVNILL